MSIINEVTPPKRDYKKFPFVHHAKVLWCYHGRVERVPEMYDKDYALCKSWANAHKRDSQYAAGKLLVVSMLDNEYKKY
jgi:hypothetical protein